MARPLIKTPNRFDILCGKGKECNSSEGSQRYRLVIDSYRQRYASALTRHEKCALTLEIYELLAKTSSRFLKYIEKEKAWEELPFMTARDKIGHALRFANRKDRRGMSLPSLPPIPVPSNVGSAMSLLRGAQTPDLDLPGSSATISACQTPATGTPTLSPNTFNALTRLAQARNLNSADKIMTRARPKKQTHLDLEPNAVLPPRAPPKKTSAAESNDILEQAKQHLMLAFRQSPANNSNATLGMAQNSSNIPDEKPAAVPTYATLLPANVASSLPLNGDNILEQAKQHLMSAFGSNATLSAIQNSSKGGPLSQAATQKLLAGTNLPDKKPAAVPTLFPDYVASSLPVLPLDGDDAGSVGTIEDCNWAFNDDMMMTAAGL